MALSAFSLDLSRRLRELTILPQNYTDFLLLSYIFSPFQRKNGHSWMNIILRTHAGHMPELDSEGASLGFAVDPKFHYFNR
jgi:hypothetical protein